MRRIIVVAALIASFAAVQRAHGLAMETKGNAPLSPANFTAWKGIADVINHKSRIYTWWVNGNERMFYMGDAAQLDDVLARFSRVDIKHRFVVLSPAPGTARTLSGGAFACGWQLHVVGGIAASRATAGTDDLEWYKDPVLTVHVGEGIDPAKLRFPKGLTLRAGPPNAGETKAEAATRKCIAEYLEKRKTEP